MRKLDDRSAWEKAWEKKFADAEETPPMHNWAGIEARLASAESDRYKKRAVFFQWVAAAAVMLTIGTTAYWLTYVSENNGLGNGAVVEQTEADTQNAASEAKTTEASNALAENQPDTQNNSAESTEKEAPQASGAQEGVGSALAYQQQDAGAAADRKGAPDGVVAGTSADENEEAAMRSATPLIADLTEEQPDIEKLSGKNFLAFHFDEVETEIERVWLFRSSDKINKETTDDARFWLGTTVAANTFDPNFKEQSSAANAFSPSVSVGKGEASLAQTDSWQQEEQAEPSVNLSVQGGVKLSKRWSLQAGVQYGAYRINSQAGTYIDLENSQAYPLHYSNFSPDRLQRVRAGSRLASPVAVTNNFEMLSLPLRVGYTLIDGKFNLTLNPGISSEIFLRNQLITDNELVNSYTVHSGSESPYRSLYFSGILGAQFSYILGDHYLFTLEPSYRQAITDFNKSDAIFESRPSSLGLGVGIRYLIK